MEVPIYFPEEIIRNRKEIYTSNLKKLRNNKRNNSVNRKENLIEFCVATINGCESFEQLQTARNYCNLVLQKIYKMPEKVKKEVEFVIIESKRIAIFDYFRERLVDKAKKLTPYLCDLPEEELNRILWS